MPAYLDLPEPVSLAQWYDNPVEGMIPPPIDAASLREAVDRIRAKANAPLPPLDLFRSRCPQCGSITVAAGKPAEVCTAGCGYQFKDSKPQLGKRFAQTCPLCNCETVLYGAAPMACASCFSPFELAKDEPVHCAICNTQAPYVLGMLRGHSQKGLVPNCDGWSRSFFPWPDKLMRSGDGIAMDECTWLCPKDAEQVAKFIAHLKHPMRTEYENL